MMAFKVVDGDHITRRLSQNIQESDSDEGDREEGEVVTDHTAGETVFMMSKT